MGEAPLDTSSFERSPEDRLDSWKEIAAYLKRDVTTVQRWEKREGMPVHRHLHDKGGSVYAVTGELDSWAKSRRAVPDEAEKKADLEKQLDRAEPPTPTGVASPSRRPAPWALLSGMLFLCLSAAALWMIIRHHDAARLGAAGPIRSLAVLPLQNLSGDPREEYFADGITDALITELAHTPNLRVVSRTSVMQDRGSKKGLRQIASELDVDAIVEGSVVRSGNRIRITAQLIDARSDRHLWAESFEEQMNDVLMLQDKVARDIAAHTEAVLAPAKEISAARISPEAYDAYLRGLYYLHQRSAAKSVSHFREAISLDPAYPAAYAGLADALVSETVLSTTNPPDTEAEALAAARRAIQLDPASGEAYAALGFAEITYRKNWTEGGQDLEKGLALSPSNSFAELQYSLFLDSVGRTKDGVTHMRRGLKLDPLSFVMNRQLGATLYFDRNYREALIHLDHAAEMEPRNYQLVENWRSRSYEKLGQLNEAERADLLTLSGWVSDAKLAPLRTSYGHSGWKGYQAARIELLAKEPELACGSYEMGESYLRLGDRDRAFEALKRGTSTSCFWVSWLAVDPMLDGLRSDPRFDTLLERVHLPVSGVAVSNSSRVGSTSATRQASTE